jgi:hypothetical protein
MDIAQALKSLVPKSEFSVEDNDYDKINWFEWNESPIPSKEEVFAEIEKLKAAEPMRLLRVHRDKLLAEVDWVTWRAYGQKTDVPEEWATYQQALRDLPEIATPVLDPTSPLGISGVDWPVKPQ